MTEADEKHVSADEAAAAVDRGPVQLREDVRSLRPTRKWWAALIVGLGTIATAAVVTEGFGADETVALIGLVVERAVAFLVPNDPTPGGVLFK